MHFPAKAIEELLTERERQDAEWGGAVHDDGLSQSDWRYFIQKQVNNMIHPNRMTTAITDMPNFRRRLVCIGALAIAAIEAMDREQNRVESAKDGTDNP